MLVDPQGNSPGSGYAGPRLAFSNSNSVKGRKAAQSANAAASAHDSSLAARCGTFAKKGATVEMVYQPMPVIVYGTEFWEEVLNFDGLRRWGTIGPEDFDLFRRCDSPEEAFEYLREELGPKLDRGLPM